MNIFKRAFCWLFRGSEQYQQEQALKESKKASARAYARKQKLQKAIQTLREAHSATTGLFIVADLETTGLSSTAEILEMAAICADAQGKVYEEFTTLVRTRRAVPAEISELTGISNEMMLKSGIPLEQAFDKFCTLCANRPVFFHNASFDKRFVLSAAEQLGREFSNPVLCTLKVARAAWPQLSSHKLRVLAQHLGVPLPTHRGLADVKATLEVLIAARSLARL